MANKFDGHLNAYSLEKFDASSATFEKLLRLQTISREEQFHYAVCNGHVTYARMLLAKSPGLANRLDDRMISPMHYCAKYSQLQIMDLLISAGGNINIKGNGGMRPLHVATHFGQIMSVRYLLQRGDLHIDAKNDTENTALHLACKNRRGEIAELLIGSGANMALKDDDGLTALHHSISSEDVALASQMIDQSAPMFVCDRHGVTPLLLSCRKGNYQIFENIIERAKRNNINIGVLGSQVDTDGSSALILATQSNQFQMVKTCIEAGWDVNYPRKDGVTALHVAVSMNLGKIAEILINSGANVNQTDNDLRSPLHECAIKDNSEIARLLILKGANVNQQDACFMTPLHHTCQLRSPCLAEVFQRIPFNYTLQDKHNRTIFHWLVLNGNLKALVYFVEYMESSDVAAILDKLDENDCTALHYAVKMDRVDIVKLLLQKEANPWLRDRESSSSIQYSAKFGSMDSLLFFAEIYAHRGTQREAVMHNLLHASALAGTYEAFKYLSGIGKDCLHCTIDQKTLIMSAASGGNANILSILIEEDVEIEATDLDKNTALHFATAAGSTECTELLVTAGARLKANQRGETQLDNALRRQKSDCSEIFFSPDQWKTTMAYRRENGKTHMKELIKYAPDLAMRVLDYSIDRSSHNYLDSNYKVTYNFSKLDPGPDDPASQNRKFFALKTMARYKHLDLIKHPVSSALLNRKWRGFCQYTFWADFAMYLAFLGALTALVLISGPPKASEISSDTGCPTQVQAASNNTTAATSAKRQPAETRIVLLKILILTSVAVRLLVEIVKLAGKRLKYIKDKETVFSLVLYGLTIGAVFPVDSDICLKEWVLATGSVAMAWILLIFYFQHISYIGIYSLMFMRVIFSLVKVLIIFTFFIMGFALAFYIALRKQSPFNKFLNSLLKTFDMTLGELELVSYFVDGNNGNFDVISKILFVVFSIFMTIALMNLLVGIAVGDIGEIETAAELKQLTLTINMVYEVESKFPRFIRRIFYTATLQRYPNKGIHPVKRFILRQMHGENIKQNMVPESAPEETDPIESRLDKLESMLEEILQSTRQT